MSKNTNLSFLTDFLTADIVNSRVGMNNSSPQSTFDVTGTGKFSGILTLGSTVSNGTYTYTLPSATGTLALVGGSGVGTVTSVAAITLGTSGTDLTSTVANGTTTPVITLNVPDASVTARGVITTGTQYIAGLKIFTSTIVANVDLQLPAAGTASTTFIKNISGSGLTSIGSNGFGFNNSDNIYFSGSNKAGGVFAFNNTGNRTYTLQDASGTLAFTSEIPTNAVGGTGTLNTIPKFTAATTIGNSNIFDSGSIIYNTNPAAGTFAWQFNGSTVTGQSYGAQVIAGTNASDIGFKVMNAAASINYLVVRGDGLVTLTGALNGTTASFAVSVGNSNTGLDLTNNGALGYGNSINFYQNATKVAQIFCESSAANTSEILFKTTVASTLATRLIINSAGNVGIGTASPANKLFVVASGTPTTNGNNSGVFISHLTTGATTDGVGIGSTGASTYKWIQSYDGNLCLNPAGNNVGIGTATPITRLSLGDYVGARLPYINGTTNTFSANGITVSSSNSGSAAIGGGLDLTNNTYSVGAYSPVISFSSLGVNSAYNNSYAGIWGILGGPGGDNNWVVGSLAFGTASSYGITEKMRIASDGNVLIGTTTNAGFKLDVAGTGRFIGPNASGRGQLSIQSNNASNAARASWYYDTVLQGNIGTTSGDFYVEAVNNLSLLGGKIIVGSTSGSNSALGTKTKHYIVGDGSINAAASHGSMFVGAGTTLGDTGISVNQATSGMTMILIASINTSTGTSTNSAVYIVRFYFDGNNTPTATYIGGSSDFVTFGQSGSNTLTISGSSAGNKSYAWFVNKYGDS